MTDANQIADLCEDAIASQLELAECFLESLKFDKKIGQHLTAVCLYARLIELAAGCKALLEKNALAGIPIMLRSMFEADIDLVNCLKSKEYFKRMYSGFLDQKIRLAREAASATSNPFVADIQQQLDPKQVQQDAEKELQGLKDARHTPLNICERATLAGRINEYRTVYNLFCLAAHNNIQALESWHLQKKDNGDYRVVVFSRMKSDLIPHMDTIAGILLAQTKALQDFLGTTDIDLDRYYEDQRERRDRIRNDQNTN